MLVIWTDKWSVRILCGADLSSYSDCGGGASSSHRPATRSADDNDMGSSVNDEKDSTDESENCCDDTENERPRQVRGSDGDDINKNP